ncbi:MAG: hypothetical protein Q9186_005994 [Xanthomendoza sp. 1 TL-2023]
MITPGAGIIPRVPGDHTNFPARQLQPLTSASGPTTPAQPPVQPQPLDGGYGARTGQSQSSNDRGGSYIYSPPNTHDTNALAQSFGQLSTTSYGSHSHSFAPPPRTSSISHAARSREQPTVYHELDSRPRGDSTSHAQTSRPVVSFGSTSVGSPESSRAAGKRVAPDYGAMSPPAHSIDPIPSFEREVISSSTYPARVGGASTASRHGSSLEAQTSTGSYLNYDTNAASAAAFGKRSTQLSVQSSKDILDPDEFYVRRPPHNFFVEGKVFIKLHTEDAGNKSDQSSFGFSTIPYGQRAYSQLRRFVVVKAKPREHYCLCVPITTYSGQGATKKSIDQSAHAIIYTGKSPPDKLPEEQRMNKDPLRVIPDRRDEKLDSRSRINLGKIYTVEWNTKVKEIGHLERNSLVKMIAYWKSVMDI